jgi:hypothetical protein
MLHPTKQIHMSNILSPEKQTAVISALAEGNSIAASSG